MRSRSQIVDSLEAAFREELVAAERRGDPQEISRLQLDFVRDQIRLEVLLDVRELLLPADDVGPGTEERVSGLLDTAQKLRNLTRLR